MAKQRSWAGFTLIEVLLVIGILTILLSIVIVSVRPRDQFVKAYNTQRKSDVTAIINAIHAYASNQGGTLPSGITSTPKLIVAPVTDAATQINLCAVLVPNYIADIPIDPENGTENPADSLCDAVGAQYNSRYTVQTAGGNRVTVTALDAEDETISVTR